VEDRRPEFELPFPVSEHLRHVVTAADEQAFQHELERRRSRPPDPWPYHPKRHRQIVRSSRFSGTKERGMCTQME